MKDKTAVAIMLTLLYVSSLAGIHTAEAQVTPRVYLSPKAISAAPGGSFSVDVILENVTNLVGWEFTLFWNNSVLECAADVVHIPAGYNWETPNNLDLGGMQQDYNTTSGRYHKVLVTIPEAEPHPTPFNGTMVLVTLTFNVIAEGSCVLDLRDTKLADYNASPIGHKTGDGYFHGAQPRETWLYLGLCAHFFGVTIGDPRWDPSVDINVDGTIDVYDIVLLTEEFEENA